MIIVWAANLTNTDAYFSGYLLCGIVAILCLADNYRYNREWTAGGRIAAKVLALVFGLAVALANYWLFEVTRDPYEVSAEINIYLNTFKLWCTALGGYIAAENVLRCACDRCFIPTESGPERRKPWMVFAGSFVIIAAVDLLFLFFAVYPGSMTPDSINQINQIRDGIYSNHHPFWHTMVIKLILDIGYAVFGDFYRAVALYSVAQILVMSACFGYVLMSLYQAGVSKIWIVFGFILYATMPYNISYSSTMWKDVLFGGAVCTFVTSMLRILRGIGKKQGNYVIFSLSALGFCLWRSNGFLALLAAFPVFAVCLRKDHRKMLVLLLGALTLGWVMKGPVLSALGVPQPDLVESLSIPVQQVARVIVEERELTAEEENLINRVVDIDEVPELYRSHISDNIKNEIRSKNNAYFEENIGQYLKLWLQLLRKYPVDYFRAWVDETKGYWGGGYKYWIYADHSGRNDLDTVLVGQGNGLYMLFNLYFTLTENMIVFEVLNNIGLHVWILVIAAFVNRFRKRREWLLAIPLLTMVLTLMVATPVFSEFRYAYGIFTAFPLVIGATLQS